MTASTATTMLDSVKSLPYSFAKRHGVVIHKISPQEAVTFSLNTPELPRMPLISA